MKIPLFSELEKAQNILIVGAGGGFDVFCGLPIYFWLRNAGKQVHLANLSFTEFQFCSAERLTPSLMRVLPQSEGSSVYFPELHLSQWITERFGETPVYAIERSGAQPVLAAYQWLIENLRPDTLILMDGGTDMLLRGDEVDLGTPEEDMVSLHAAHAIQSVARKFLINIGFGIDTFHGVCHAHFLENVAGLIEEGGYLGTWSILKETEEFRLYCEAYDYTTAKMPRHPSIVNTSIISAVRGWFGDRHANSRTEGSKLFINPLMAICWAFQLDHVAKRNLYLNKIGHTTTYRELTNAIQTFHLAQAKTRPWTECQQP